MRGVFGLLLIIVGAVVAWLVIIGKFPPHPTAVDTTGYVATATSFPDTSGNTNTNTTVLPGAYKGVIPS